MSILLKNTLLFSSYFFNYIIRLHCVSIAYYAPGARHSKIACKILKPFSTSGMITPPYPLPSLCLHNLGCSVPQPSSACHPPISWASPSFPHVHPTTPRLGLDPQEKWHFWHWCWPPANALCPSGAHLVTRPWLLVRNADFAVTTNDQILASHPHLQGLPLSVSWH